MSKPRGGHRPNAGALVRNIHLSEDDARILRTILLARHGKATVEQAHNFIVGLINEQWQAYDEMIQAKTEGEGADGRK